MEILGIGPLEVLLIIIIALIVLGPDEMVKAGTSVGKFIRNIRRSETWQGFQRMSRSLKTLPEDLARHSGLEDIRKEVAKSAILDEFTETSKSEGKADALKAWTETPADTEGNRKIDDDDENQSSSPSQADELED